MLGNDTDVKAVAPLLHAQIAEFDSQVNIVERPSVGTLVVPTLTGWLISDLLRHSLRSFAHRQTGKVFVQCRRLTPSQLMLEVAADRAWPPRNEVTESFVLGDLNALAPHLRGVISKGGVSNGGGRPWLDVYYRLIVQISL